MAKIWVKVVPQIQRDLLNTLFACKAVIEMNTPKHTFFIMDVTFFNLDETDTNDAMYRIQINTENNTKDIYIAKANLLEFTVHFA